MDPFTGGLICIGIFVHAVMLAAYTALPTTSDLDSTASFTATIPVQQQGEIKKAELNNNEESTEVIGDINNN